MNFDRLVDEYLPDSLLNKSYKQVHESAYVYDSIENLGMESWGFPEPIKEVEHNVQKMLRPLFGKKGIREDAIGHHPDYQHLAGTEKMMNGYVCTLFLDIAKSSRLNLIYDIKTASVIKNRILKRSNISDMIAVQDHDDDTLYQAQYIEFLDKYSFDDDDDDDVKKKK